MVELYLGLWDFLGFRTFTAKIRIVPKTGAVGHPKWRTHNWKGSNYSAYCYRGSGTETRCPNSVWCTVQMVDSLFRESGRALVTKIHLFMESHPS